MKKSKSAFTLIELLVVISIIALLAGLALPALNKARKQGFKIKDISNLKQVGVTIKLYANDNDGVYPIQWKNGTNVTDVSVAASVTDANEAFRALFGLGVIKDERIFNTPGTPIFKVGDNELGTAPGFSQALDTKENSYMYWAGRSEGDESNDPLACDAFSGTATKPAGQPYTIDGLIQSINDGAGLNVLFVDSSVQYIAKDGTGKVIIKSLSDNSFAQLLKPKI